MDIYVKIVLVFNFSYSLIFWDSIEILSYKLILSISQVKTHMEYLVQTQYSFVHFILNTWPHWRFDTI